jgi:chromate transporter
MRDIGQLALLFLRLGVTAFGGPAAHIAMMEDEVVKRRRWLERERFLDLLGATNLIPGPNSTEMAIHIGFVRGGVVGLAVAGVCFVFPAVLLTTGLAWVYVKFQTVPQVEALLYGIKPAVIVIIIGAVRRLGRTAAKNSGLIVLGAIVMVVALLGVNEVFALLGGGVIGVLWHLLRRWQKRGSSAMLLFGLPLFPLKGLIIVATTATKPISLTALGLFFLKVGCVLFGSGYVLVAFLQGDLVDGYGWLTQQQLLDAIAIGQFTPGPVLSTSAFIGYILAGMQGAAVAAVGIFAPSFLFVLITSPLIPKLRQSAVAGAFLDAVNASAIGVMAAVSIELARHTLTDWGAWVIAIGAAIVVFKFSKVNSAWLVLGGAIVGWVLKMTVLGQ